MLLLLVRIPRSPRNRSKNAGRPSTRTSEQANRRNAFETAPAAKGMTGIRSSSSHAVFLSRRAVRAGVGRRGARQLHLRRLPPTLNLPPTTAGSGRRFRRLPWTTEAKRSSIPSSLSPADRPTGQSLPPFDSLRLQLAPSIHHKLESSSLTREPLMIDRRFKRGGVGCPRRSCQGCGR